MIFKIALSILTGLLTALSFPKWNLWILSWVSLIPMLYAADGLNLKKSFFWGWFSGWISFCGILYWIVPTFRAAGVSTIVGILSVSLLSAYIAVYYGLFTAIFQFLLSQGSNGSGTYDLPQKKFRIILTQGAITLSSAVWVSLEYLRTNLFGGFPWGLLGYSQWQNHRLIQISQLTGIYGVSALMVAVNLSLYICFKKRRIVSELFFLFPLLIGSLIFMNMKTINHSPQPLLKVAVLQGNIDQYKKWGPEYVQEILSAYGELSGNARTKNPDLIIWPETSAPGWIPEDRGLLQWIQKRVQKTARFNLIGAVTSEGGRNYNSAFLFSPDGKISNRYDKMHLVPFGEQVPFQSILGNWIPVLNQLGGFHSGKNVTILETPKARLGTSICYEAIFPGLIRRQAHDGADILVNMTNDGWYLDTAAPEQHFSMNVFRAIENQRYLIRAANTGISGVIQPDGKILKMTKLNEKTFLTEMVSPDRVQTFYTKFGDIFAWICCGISLATILSIFSTKWI